MKGSTKMTAIGGGTFLVGMIVGGVALGGSSTSTTPVAAKPVTVTKTVAAKPLPAKTVTKTKEVTPKSCIKVLDGAVQFAVAVEKEHSEISAAATEGGQTGDVSTFLDKLNNAVVKMSASTDAITADLGTAGAECRAKA
jgi:hypothetical protein